ncbi:MAG: adenylate/guanylate cyclase domain-containing protein, partial [Chloroflexi bacterium]|nr:adenylate/guanylate cyclase domain-containing protein [Chloroflexota bacterium]
IAAGRAAAALIPDARFITLEGDVAYAYFQPEQALKPIRDFLDEGREREPSAAPAGAGDIDVHTILFTDMESSTSMRQQIGDEKAQEIVHVHNDIVREALKANGGREIKHTGDAIMASFQSASQALQAAVTIQRLVAAHREEQPDTPLRVYIGLNAGEPIAEEGDLFGTSVDLAKRICDQCQPGEILISDVVRQLVAGKEFLFSDIGDTALRGFEDPVKLWELRWQEDA